MERKEALLLGLPTYKTGRPCKHGHLDARRSDSGACCECLRKSSNEVYFDARAMRDQVALQTAKIHVLIKPEAISVLKMVVDAMAASRFPGVPPSSVNPFPYRSRYAGGTRRLVTVSVPLQDIDRAREFADTLSEQVDMSAIRADLMQKARVELGVKETPSYIPAP